MALIITLNDLSLAKTELRHPQKYQYARDRYQKMTHNNSKIKKEGVVC